MLTRRLYVALRALVVTLLLVACSSPRTPAASGAGTDAPTARASATQSATPDPSPTPQLRDATPRGFTRVSFDGGTHEATVLRELRIELGASPIKGSYADPHGAGTIADERGTWTSAPISVPFEFDELVASWNAATPPGTWIEVQMRAGGAPRMTKWYTLAIWSAGDGTIRRTTVRGQDDADGRVNVDTFVRADGASPFTSYQMRVTLHRIVGASSPVLRQLTAVTSARGDRLTFPSAFGGVARDLDVPTLSQETHSGHYPEYDGGGEAWCSPTSTAMVLAFWKSGPSAADLAAFPGAGHADGAVDHAARYTYDWSYRGAGNWPYNTAYAAGFGLEAFVTRLRSLAEAEKFIEAGIPLVASLSGTLPGFLFTSTEGHLLVIRGFAANGDVITNDPAVRANAHARKVYPRADFERVWITGSSGTVYVIHPGAGPRSSGVRLPANVPGLPPNW